MRRFFAFALRLQCASTNEVDEALKILSKLGYEIHISSKTSTVVRTNYNFTHYTADTKMDSSAGDDNRYNLSKYDKDLFRDLASVSTNDTWQDNEIAVNEFGTITNIRTDSAATTINSIVNLRRPTIEEVCAHHNYKVEGRNIIPVEPATEGLSVRPPIGLEPQWAHIEQRLTDVREAVNRYMNAMYPIPVEWIQEYNELVEKHKQIKKNG